MAHVGAFLGVFATEALEKLREHCCERTFRAGSILMRQGEEPQTMLLIQSGRVRLERSVPGIARPLHVADVGPGDVVGEVGVLIGQPRVVTARAIDDVTAVEISRRETLDAMLEIPGLPTVLERLVRKRLKEIEELGERVKRYL